MHNIFTPNCRIRRSHFWGYLFMLMILESSIGALVTAYPYDGIHIIIHKTLGYIVRLAEVWSISCLMVQRLHDLNRPLEHLLYLLVPIYNIYVLFCILFVKGNDEINKYGKSPYCSFGTCEFDNGSTLNYNEDR